ncbi:MAG TPA: DUF1028 domain-containing protein [Phycisphaerales bacterium]|nr:DUF1028 domain-containing protein [Phycisphaerales bacterium]
MPESIVSTSALCLIAASLLAMVSCASDPSTIVQTAEDERSPSRPVATYSIVARDAKTGELGVAVQSHWFSVGSVVPWAESGVGAVATQSFVDPRYGPMGLALMKGGRGASEALKALTSSDDGEAVRQVGMVDASGGVATHTGLKCIRYASHVSGETPDGSIFTAQANMMMNAGVPEAMADAFQKTGGDLADRLLAALRGAQARGGDIRGMQSAALLVVKGKTSGKAWEDRRFDLRVEDHTKPVDELARLLRVARAYEHMNNGDLAMEKKDIDGALREYHEAQELDPASAEMAFWTGVSLANAGRVDESLPFFKRAFEDKSPGAAWRELLRRLPASGLLPDDPELMEKMMSAK